MISDFRDEYTNDIRTYISKSLTNTLMEIFLTSNKCESILQLQNPDKGHTFVDGIT